MKMRTSSLTAAVLAGLLVAGAPATGYAGETPGASRPIGTPPWWAAFGDPALDRLLGNGLLEPAADRDRQLELQARVCAAYLEARIYSARLRTAAMALQAAGRQWLLLEPRRQADPDTGRAVAFAMREAMQRERRFAELRVESVDRLHALLTHRWSEEELNALLAPALDDATLPLPTFEIPEALPGLVLRQRADVLAAEATLLRADEPATVRHLRIAEFLQALSDPIRPNEAREAARPQDAFGVALQLARTDVSVRLGRIAGQGQQVRAQARYLQHLILRFQTLQDRYRAGQVAESETLTALQDLLTEQDRLAASIGLAGLAWIALQQGIGGAGEARTSDLLGAGTADRD